MSRQRMDKSKALSLAAIVVHGVMFVRDVWQHGTESNAEANIERGAELLLRIDQKVEQLDND